MTEEARPVRESFIAEVLMSVIITASILSCLMMIRGFNEFITITTYPQLIPLLLAVIHTIIRRKWPKLWLCFILHVLASAAFYFALIFIPATGYGDGLSNRIYLAAIVFFFTVFSFSYRLDPKILPSDSQVAAIPACVFPVTGFFYIMMNRPDLVHDLITNTILAAVMYLVMRQIAVFDTKYYHSIRSSSRAPAQLRRQNYKTTASLIGIFILSLVVVSLVPVETLSNIVKNGIIVILRFVIPVIFAIIDFFARLVKDLDTGDENETGKMPDLEDNFQDAPWLRILSIAIAILILMGIILLIINTIRLMIRNAPKYGKEKETTNDGIVTDTIDNIRPDSNPFFRRRPDFGKGYERRVRKQFYDKTMSAMRKGLSVSDSSTPGQIEKVLTENGDKDFASLRKEYEKIRYGN